MNGEFLIYFTLFKTLIYREAGLNDEEAIKAGIQDTKEAFNIK